MRTDEDRARPRRRKTLDDPLLPVIPRRKTPPVQPWLDPLPPQPLGDILSDALDDRTVSAVVAEEHVESPTLHRHDGNRQLTAR